MPPRAQQTYHITFGTYAMRLHDDPRPTVDRRHNQINTPFPPPDPDRQQRPADPPLRLTREQCEHIEITIPQFCDRGGWTLITCAAPFEYHKSEPRRADAVPSQYGTHVHILLTAPTDKPPKQIRRWIKRWLTESLTQAFGPPPTRWWAQGGSTKPVSDNDYRKNPMNYINKQRTITEPHHADAD